MNQTTSSGTSSSIFGITNSSPFMFRVSAGTAGSGAFGMNTDGPHSSPTSGAFAFGARQSGSTGSTAPFEGGLSQNSLGAHPLPSMWPARLRTHLCSQDPRPQGPDSKHRPGGSTSSRSC
ncbi:hypothetical protein MC885_018744 [Smutsia gigantea]|nr:hypothetical protein MC885_018744 [Smutsia gigantea]